MGIRKAVEVSRRSSRSVQQVAQFRGAVNHLRVVNGIITPMGQKGVVNLPGKPAGWSEETTMNETAWQGSGEHTELQRSDRS